MLGSGQWSALERSEERRQERPEELSEAACGAFWTSLESPGEPMSAGGPFKENLAVFDQICPPRGGDSEIWCFLLIY